jgi:hypothetical protein
VQDPRGDLVRHGSHEIGDGHDGAFGVGQRLGYERLAGELGGMERLYRSTSTASSRKAL